MDAAKKIILALWLAVLAVANASALAHVAPENRVWKNFAETPETHQVESAQPVQTHQEKPSFGYENASGCCLAAKTAPTFSGTAKPWTKGATPNSTYTHIDPKTGKAVQNAIYDDAGDVVGHVDFKNHGPGAPSGHGHTFPQPGNPASGHGAGKPHISNNQLPPGRDTLPPGVLPHTPLGQ
jgi:hypothetical protein